MESFLSSIYIVGHMNEASQLKLTSTSFSFLISSNYLLKTELCVIKVGIKNHKLNMKQLLPTYICFILELIFSIFNSCLYYHVFWK